MGRLLRVFEYEKLTVHSTCSEHKPVGQRVINKLWQFNDNYRNIYFEGVRNGVRFKNYVGVIQVGSLTIEILPKADKNPAREVDRGNWHNALLGMLKVCKKIKLDAVSEASLRKKHHSLLDLYFEIYVNEVNQLIKQGLVKKYRKQSGNVLALKGQLKFSQNIQKNLVHRERFYTNHQVYDNEHLLHQILLRALRILKIVSSNTVLQDAIERTLAVFPEIKEVSIKIYDFDRIILDRKTNKYAEAFKIAKMIIFNYSPDIKGGSENMLALLFDMNKLWEEYVFRMLRKLENEDLKVNFQNRQKFWMEKIIKPDIVVEKKIEGTGKLETFVIDTKWKILDDPDSPGDADLKQMYAYNMYWGSEKSLLLYPSTDPKIADFGIFHKGRVEENLCKVSFVNVMEGPALDQNIGKKVLALLD